MASFSCDITSYGQTAAYISATFTGGDANYSRYRYIKVTIGGQELALIRSTTQGGANSSFGSTTGGLSPGTTYYYTAVLCYDDGQGNIVETSYTDSGYFTTDSPPPSSKIRIYAGGTWYEATPYIFNGSQWVEATPYIYNGGWQS